MESRLDTDPQEVMAWRVCRSRFRKERRLVKAAVALLGADRPWLLLGTGGGGGPSGGGIVKETVRQVQCVPMLCVVLIVGIVHSKLNSTFS